MSKEQPTIVEVAEAAGVAISTVSRVLNGGSASVASQKKVSDAIKSLGFAPSAAAQNLKKGTTGIVGIAGASTTAPWFSELLGGLESVLSQRAASVAICGLEREGRYDAAPVNAWIRDRRVDQLVLVRPGERERSLISRCWKQGIPVVCMAPDITFNRGLNIRADNFSGGVLAAEHLFELGHREFCFLGGPSDSVDTQDRLRGIQSTLTSHGISLPASRIVFAKSYDFAAGAELADSWLRRKTLRRARAVIVGNDSLALAFMRRVQAQGISVPEDVSVVGFDGVPAGAFVWPGLTSVAQPVNLMGVELARTLMSPDANEQLSRRASRVYSLSLVVRESSSAPWNNCR